MAGIALGRRNKGASTWTSVLASRVLVVWIMTSEDTPCCGSGCVMRMLCTSSADICLGLDVLIVST